MEKVIMKAYGSKEGLKDFIKFLSQKYLVSPTSPLLKCNDERGEYFVFLVALEDDR